MEDLAKIADPPGWVTETIVIWTQFPARKGILDLSNRQLSEVPSEIFRLRKLAALCFAKNNLTTIPDEIQTFSESSPSLKEVDCSENEIVKVSSSLGKLISIETLNLSHNQLSFMPNCINSLFNLVNLDLSFNNISTVESSIASLVFLETLNMSNNNIKIFPDFITAIGSLKYLDFSHNKISSLSSQVRSLTRLKSLRLHNNCIEDIPDELGLLITVDEFTIHENPLSLKPVIKEKDLFGRNKLLKYLRNRMRAQQRLRMYLFTEKDNDRNTRWEIIEGETKPILAGATIEKLVLFLTQVATPDIATLSCLENCYCYFIPPEELLRLFMLRYQKNVGATTPESQKVEEIIQGRIIYVTITLLKRFNLDQVKYTQPFARDMHKLTELIGSDNGRHVLDVFFLNKSVQLDWLDDVAAAEVKNERVKRQQAEEKGKKKNEEDMMRANEKRKKKFIKQHKKADKQNEKIARELVSSVNEKHLLAFTPSEIALQICLLDSQMFSCIPRNEFIKQKWAKANPEKFAPKITNCIENFNNLSNWFITWIIKQINIKMRVRTLHHILDIASELFKLGDYSGLFAIGSAISCAPISRLKETFKLVDEKRSSVIETLNKLTDNTGNYKFYKELLSQSIQAGPCVPHLAIYLKNLTFTEEGNPNYYEDTDIINLVKFRFITQLLNEISAMQPKGYSFLVDEDAKIRKIILEKFYRIDNSDQQYDFSLLCEASKRSRPAISIDHTKSPANIDVARRKSVGVSGESKKTAMPAFPRTLTRSNEEPEERDSKSPRRARRSSGVKTLKVSGKLRSRSKSPGRSKHKRSKESRRLFDAAPDNMEKSATMEVESPLALVDSPQGSTRVKKKRKRTIPKVPVPTVTERRPSLARSMCDAVLRSDSDEEKDNLMDSETKKTNKEQLKQSLERQDSDTIMKIVYSGGACNNRRRRKKSKAAPLHRGRSGSI